MTKKAPEGHEFREEVMADSLEQAHEDLYLALNEMLVGDAAPVLSIWSEADDISYGGPFGEFHHGRAVIKREFYNIAQRQLQGEIVASDVTMIEGVDLGYTTCFEHGRNHVIDGDVVNLKHRATNIFRKEPGGWKLVHHHTDSSATS